MFYDETADTGVFESDNFEVFAENTAFAAVIDDAKTFYPKEDDEEEHISLRWSIVEGEHINRKLFQKLRVRSSNTDKNARANKIMMAIDFNCGKILSGLKRYPSDDELKSAIANKTMQIVVGIWEQGDKKGNWIKSVYGINDEIEQKEQKEDEPF